MTVILRYRAIVNLTVGDLLSQFYMYEVFFLLPCPLTSLKITYIGCQIKALALSIKLVLDS